MTNYSDSDSEPDLISQDEVAYRLGISRTSLWRLICAGDLPLVKIGRRALVPRRAVEAFIQERSRVA